ncbi:hypothetical protein Goklo_000208 [Gossypium klotzschianum]|uniref:Cytochrome P450 n=1 Tax=Gossypium klotzschianum TaxID=34286 RepID=A0A7J8VXC6_9ROSI|nr:hypothetical protein [Gossypium klotzschianum]
MDMMGPMWMMIAVLAILGGLKWVLRRVNWWVYETELGDKRHALPPGDLGWPFIGNMWSFLRAFRSNDPDSFIGSFVSRFGHTGIYKAFMFGNPSVIVTMPETCKRVLNDDDAFKPGWPTSTVELIGKKSFICISYYEHKRLRHLTAASINGHEALSVYIPYIEENVVCSLEKWSEMGEMEFLTHLRMLTFRIIMFIFLSSESEEVMAALEKEYTDLNHGVRSMAINVPGFAYYKALKARKKLVAVFQSVVNERRNERKTKKWLKKEDMLDALMEVKDEKGETLEDEEIIDIMLMYLNAGHESSAHTTMWATIFLQQHPHFLQKAKDYAAKASTFLPFGAGSRLCPGNDLAKLEIAIFLHHFLLNYEYVIFVMILLERLYLNTTRTSTGLVLNRKADEFILCYTQKCKKNSLFWLENIPLGSMRLITYAFLVWCFSGWIGSIPKVGFCTYHIQDLQIIAWQESRDITPSPPKKDNWKLIMFPCVRSNMLESEGAKRKREDYECINNFVSSIQMYWFGAWIRETKESGCCYKILHEKSDDDHDHDHEEEEEMVMFVKKF